MKKLQISFLSHKQGVSYAISAVIITATTVTLVLVASIYAYQVLEQQRGMAEFEVAKESILAFNDALENVAWKPQAARSARFTVEYGDLQLIPNADGEVITVNARVGDSDPQTLYKGSTGFVKYYIQNKYVNFGEGYRSYILGDDSSIVDNSVESYGRALIEQISGRVSITLDYRVRAMRTSVINVTENGQQILVNYVEIWMIKVMVDKRSSYVHDFDLKARCLNVTTTSYSYDVYDEDTECTIDVQLGVGSEPSSATIPLYSGKVVFNVVVTEMQVTV